MLLQDVLKTKTLYFESRRNFGSFCPLPGPLRAIVFLAPNPPSQISAYASSDIADRQQRLEKLD